MIPRFHCPPALAELAPGAHIELPLELARHAVKVLRLHEGDALVLFDGSGGEWSATLQKVGAGGTAQVAVHAYSDRDCEAPLAITLAQALPSGDKMDWVVEKAVELGVAAVQPVAAQRSVIRLSGERMQRRVAHWNAIASAACAQSGRNVVPVVAPILDLPQYLAQVKSQNAVLQRGTASACLLLDPHTGRPLGEIDPPAGALSVLIGPEGGWEDSERRAAQLAGFVPVRLGPRVLRTETAGAAALAALQAIWGDF